MFGLFSKKKALPPLPAGAGLMPGSDGEHLLQHRYGTRKRALRFYDKQVLNYLSPVMQDFIAGQEIMFIATADRRGDCDCSFRFGRPGFVRVLGEHYLIYPEYRGNGVLASQGNIVENSHIGLILVDFFQTTVGLHVNGKARIVENDALMKFRKELPPDILAEIRTEGPRRPERWIMVEVEEAYIHCSKHIPLLKKSDKAISWGSDDDGLKRSDFFKPDTIPLYRRLGGDHAVEVLADHVVHKLVRDESLKALTAKFGLQTLLNRQRDFFRLVFGDQADFTPPADLREFYREHMDKTLDDRVLTRMIGHVQQTLIELDFPDEDRRRLSLALDHADGGAANFKSPDAGLSPET